MSHSETFLARWSRMKREPQKAGEVESAQARETEGSKVDSQPEPRAALPKAELGAEERPGTKFDVASLPPIESITSVSDIRAFLQSGVPAELTKAALRRAWTLDPAIRDFIGLAENQWDFTDPAGVPGFGPLEAGDDVGKLVAQALGRLPEPRLPGEPTSPGAHDTADATSSPPAPANSSMSPQVLGMPSGNQVASAPDITVEREGKADSAALQHQESPEEDESAHNRRRHGRALPR